MKKTYILFDLDGTLTDSSEGITKSVVYALKHYGIFVEDPKSLYSFIGPPLLDSFQRYYGFDEEKAREAVGKYREYYEATGIFENRVYEGIPELLKQLRGEGKTLLVATSKPKGMAERVLEHFGLAQLFSDIEGPGLKGLKETKEDVIRRLLDKYGIQDPNQAVMVGDRKYDVEGAAKFGIPCIGVLYGFGSREELSGAAWIAEDVRALGRLLLDQPLGQGEME